jgi:hypothetical protein
MTVDIEPRLLKQLRAEAARRGVSFKDLLERVLRRGLEERASGAPTPYRCPSVAMGAPAPSLNLEKALALSGALKDDEITGKLALRE